MVASETSAQWRESAVIVVTIVDNGALKPDKIKVICTVREARWREG